MAGTVRVGHPGGGVDVAVGGDQVTEVLAPLTPGAIAERRTLIAEVLVHAVYSMLNFSVQDGQSHPAAVHELKMMMTAYLISTERDAATAQQRRQRPPS